MIQGLGKSELWAKTNSFTRIVDQGVKLKGKFYFQKFIFQKFIICMLRLQFHFEMKALSAGYVAFGLSR